MTDRIPASADDANQPTDQKPAPHTDHTPAPGSAMGDAPDTSLAAGRATTARTSSPGGPSGAAAATAASRSGPAPSGPAPSDPAPSGVLSGPGSQPWPDPDGEVVPGDPPVPITVWHLSRPAAGTVVSVPMVRRLMANYTRPGAVVVDLSTGARLERPGPTGRRHAGLIVTGWPPHHPDDWPHQPDHRRVTHHQQSAGGLAAHLEVCAGHLAVGGCLAVVLSVHQTPDLLGDMVGAARDAGLTYLQHVVVAHQLIVRTPTRHDPGHRRRHRPGTRRARTHHRLDTRSDTGPDTRSDTGPDGRPDTGADSRPDARADSRPNGHPDIRPDNQPAAAPDVPDVVSDSRSDTTSDSRTPGGAGSDLGDRTRDARHLRVHTDLLIFRRPGGGDTHRRWA